jgi:transposase-like protein
MGRPKGSRSAATGKLAAADKKSRGKRYSGEEKTKILNQALSEISQGGQITKIAEKLGVTFFTLKSWLGESGQDVKSVKKPRGRKSGRPKKARQSASKEVVNSVVSETPAKRGRKPKAAAIAGDQSSSKLNSLEMKLEDLAARYKNLAHAYGELIAKVGSPKL